MEDARLKLLEAVNNILPYLGENPVTNIDARHPTVALILDNIKQQKLNLLGEGWWFNELRTTLYPSSEGEIYVPSNTISFYPKLIHTPNVTGKCITLALARISVLNRSNVRSLKIWNSRNYLTMQH